MLFLYTDGSVLSNPSGPGGYAFYYEHKGLKKLRSGSNPCTTNNIMELTAAIRGLEDLRSVVEKGTPVCVVSDSQYVVKGASEWIHRWKRRRWRTGSGTPVLNRELWEELDAVSSHFKITYKWVRGHNGHIQNTMVDKAARQAAYQAAA